MIYESTNDGARERIALWGRMPPRVKLAMNYMLSANIYFGNAVRFSNGRPYRSRACVCNERLMAGIVAEQRKSARRALANAAMALALLGLACGNNGGRAA